MSDNYVQYICVTIKSIIENHKFENITLHVISDKISKKSISRIESTIGVDSHHINLKIHIINDEYLKGLNCKSYTKYTWYRIMIPYILPYVHRILYLDSDVIVEGNLADLFNLDMSNISIGASPDLDQFDRFTFERCGYEMSKGYVCAGVLLLNLDFWRDNNLSDKIKSYGLCMGEKLKFPDQDSINFVCQDSKLFLPLKYGITKYLLNTSNFFTPQYKGELLELLETPVIIHYAGCAPWLKEYNHPYRYKWFEYGAKLNFKPKITYKTKGIKGLKVRLWDLFNKRFIDNKLELKVIEERIKRIR